MKSPKRCLAAASLLAMACGSGGDDRGTAGEPDNVLDELVATPPTAVTEYATSL
ncbi:MAG: hypothetical protein GWN99_05645, partial [Gemmatimonadetes bacterium]|nr:hypothetical protein [Gemmatimonadota bacterium]NIS00549.1 hypothetical protein [Gemmatimonadota bacterium]NIT66215.1 hypothetical protein [Gemmatimonadota bacterium]NIU54306.1 hypothetical protein [Gemmatimonadota bacterium]NIV22775.1 hypothetical protein [Gemmatimonadota bacterium]